MLDTPATILMLKLNQIRPWQYLDFGDRLEKQNWVASLKQNGTESRFDGRTNLDSNSDRQHQPWPMNPAPAPRPTSLLHFKYVNFEQQKMGHISFSLQKA